MRPIKRELSTKTKAAVLQMTDHVARKARAAGYSDGWSKGCNVGILIGVVLGAGAMSVVGLAVMYLARG